MSTSASIGSAIGISIDTPAQEMQTYFISIFLPGIGGPLCSEPNESKSDRFPRPTDLIGRIPDFYFDQLIDLHPDPSRSLIQPGLPTKISFPSAWITSLSTPLPENPSLQVQLYPPAIRFFI